jgi:hypothetical protein
VAERTTCKGMTRMVKGGFKAEAQRG